MAAKCLLFCQTPRTTWSKGLNEVMICGLNRLVDYILPALIVNGAGEENRAAVLG